MYPQACEADDMLEFLDDDEAPGERSDQHWKILVVDDDEEVHHVTRQALSDVAYGGRALHLVSAFSGQQARGALEEHNDVCVVLLDVVMEDAHTGLQLVHHIREELGNRLVRIILRTGQPGQAPERRVLIEYDINDYREKTELSAQKLITSVIASLRAYQALRELQHVNENLESLVAQRTAQLEEANRALRRSRDELQTHRDLLQYENELAKAVFARIARPHTDSVPNLRYRLAPLDVANGDVLFAARRKDDSHCLMLGDFTGHGLAAALCALPVAEVFQRIARKRRPLAALVHKINDQLAETLPDGLFLAACFVEVDRDLSRLRVWNAGAPAALLCDPDGRIKHRFVSRDLPLGVVASERLLGGSESFATAPGDRLLLCSDGLLDARNAAGEAFGERRLEQALAAGGDLYARVLGALAAFTGGAPQEDDIALAELLLGAPLSPP